MRQLIATLILLVIASATAQAGDAGDVARGAELIKRCVACHSITDKQNKIGPSLIGMFGGKVAGVGGFAYSDAMRNFALENPVWSEATMDAFLANPRTTVPGTKMGYAPTPNAQDRADLIAYLKTLTTETAPPAPKPAAALTDAERGAQLADRLHCTACHAFIDDSNRVGPSLRHIFAAPVANATGFPYSAAMKQFAIDEPVWGAIVLDRFLAAPKQLIPGTKMTYPGVANSQDRADLIAYLRVVGRMPAVPQ